MAKVISFCNAKGGTGKTTTVINVSAYLAAIGKKTLLVDVDPQANATIGSGVDFKNLDFNLYHSLMTGILPEDVVRKTNIFGWDLIPASADLAGAQIELVNVKNREFILKQVLERLQPQYDFILIDSPPSLGLLTVNALAASDEILIPVQCEYYALEGLNQLLKTIELINNNLGKEVKIMGALLTMYDSRNKLSQEIAKRVRREFPAYVFETVIPRNISLAEAPVFKKTILQYAPESLGAKAYQQLAEEIISLNKS